MRLQEEEEAQRAAAQTAKLAAEQEARRAAAAEAAAKEAVELAEREAEEARLAKGARLPADTLNPLSPRTTQSSRRHAHELLPAS